MSNSILITPRSLSKGEHPELEVLKSAGYNIVCPTPGEMPKEVDLIENVKDCVGWLAGVEPVSDEVIEAAQHLKVISRNGTGVDNLPLELLEKKGINVERAMGTNARGVAELALAFILSGLRSIATTNQGIRAGEWPRIRGQEICDCTIGVVGLGAIGKTVAELCLSLGAKVLGFDPMAPQDAVVHKNFSRVELDEVLRGSDAITLHCPLGPDGLPIVNVQSLKLVKKGLVLVNTARAGLVEESSLVNALNSGQVSGYLTDVFETEPPKPSDLTRHPNVTMTSHIGGFTNSSVSRSTQIAVENILKVIEPNADHT